MTDQVAELPADESPDAEATTDEAVAQAEGTKPQDDDATWRKRLNGQVAATNKAIAEKKELEARLAKYEKQERESELASLTEVERLKVEKEAAERRAQEAELKAGAKVLDKLYPKARAEFPEIRDEVRLAKLEALFSDDAPASEPETTRTMRAPKEAVAKREETSADILARLKTLPFN